MVERRDLGFERVRENKKDTYVTRRWEKEERDESLYDVRGGQITVISHAHIL